MTDGEIVEYNDQNPLVIDILRNVSFLDTGRNRLWCNIVIIEPVTESLPGNKVGSVRGFQDTLSPSFTRFYREDGKVEFRMKDGGPHGELRVDDEVYSVEANISKENGKVLYETREFSKGYSELWDYVRQLINKTGVINSRPFVGSELSDLVRK